MQQRRSSSREPIAGRFIAALGSAIAAAVTLVVLPLGFALVGSGVGGFVVIEGAMAWYGVMLSRVGIAVIGLAAIAGFLLGSERMANVFSIFWGTHPLWARLGHGFSKWSERYGERVVPLWVTVLLLLLLVAVAWIRSN